MESHFDEHEHWNYDYDKYMFSGKSGKQRSKKEAQQNTNHYDPNGHTRKTVNKLINNCHNQRSPIQVKSWAQNGEKTFELYLLSIVFTASVLKAWSVPDMFFYDQMPDPLS